MAWIRPVSLKPAIWATVLAISLIAVACSNDSEPVSDTASIATSVPTATSPPAATATSILAPTATSEPLSAPTATVEPEPTAAATATPVPTPSPAPSGANEDQVDAADRASVGLVAHPELGEMLVDAKGLSLYLFAADERAKSNCSGRCAMAWPPLLTVGDPTAGEGVSADHLGTIEREDGSTQATYNGWPLYYFAFDNAPGDTTGQDSRDVWYVVSPFGGPIQTNVLVNILEDADLGKVLIDRSGRVQYLYTPDHRNVSNCAGRCAMAWPPLLTVGDPTAGEGVSADHLGTIEREGGSTQATYNGWPLYYFAFDNAPGDTTGQDSRDVWYVVSPFGGPIQTNVLVNILEDADLGKVLIDRSGRVQYLYTPDHRNVSNCAGRCAMAWPPLLTVGDPTAGEGVSADHLGTIEREDGSTQATYNGWPLYYFAFDNAPGDTTGQDSRDVWYVVSPFGGPIQTNVLVNILEDADLGKVLIDRSGRVQYLYTPDHRNVSNCAGRCAMAWPPLLTVGDPTAGEGVSADHLGTIEREDGSTQATYNGWPLYYFAFDNAPGDTTGQDSRDVWYVVSPLGGPIQSNVLVNILEDADLGEVLIDRSGRVQYLYTPDHRNVSNCAGRCAMAWPPLLTVGDPTAGEGVSADHLGTIEREDGSTQATYNGWPLYYFAFDNAPGDTTGQDSRDVWYVVSPLGGPIQSNVLVNILEDADLGEVLIDRSGRVQYLYTPDHRNVSNCAGRCAMAWPPLLTVGDPTAGEGVSADHLGTIEREDGSTQATYNGWPLYYFAFDNAPGDTSGQDSRDVWYVVSPFGGPIQSNVLVIAQDHVDHGSILTDRSGRIQYLYTPDERGGSVCNGGCAMAWPPMLTAGVPTAGEGVSAEHLGTTIRDDGSTQVTYDGWPLYYFAFDNAPGDANGQASGDVWYVIPTLTPKGTTTMQASESTPVYQTLPRRSGPPPLTTGSVPHTQIGVAPVPEVHNELFRRTFTLPDVENRPTIVSLQGARGVWIAESVSVAHPEVIVAGREFTHIHPDGSLHAPLPFGRAIEAVDAGWAERHPWADQREGWEGLVLLYTPGSLEELDVVFQLIVESYNFVTGRDFKPGYGQASEVSAQDDEIASSSPLTSLAQPSDGPAGEVPVVKEIAVWGQDPDDDVRFLSPNAIAIDSAGNVYVTEFRGNRVQKVTADGALLLHWGSQGSQEAQFQNPTGISIDQDDNVFVAESGNHRVQKFTADGEWLASWGSQGSGSGQFVSAMVVDVDKDGRIYVSDWGNSRIQVLDPDGTFVATWGQPGTAKGELRTPTGLHVDRMGNIWVVDRGNNRVQKFTLGGQLLATWGIEGRDAGQFRVPTSVSVDSAGNVYVSEVDNSRVQIFDSEGQFLTELAPGKLAMPHGLAFDGAGNLYLADTGNNVVRKFAPQSSVPAATLVSAVKEDVVASPPPTSVAQPGYGEAQAGYGETQAGYGEAQAGDGETQAGYGVAQAGY